MQRFILYIPQKSSKRCLSPKLYFLSQDLCVKEEKYVFSQRNVFVWTCHAFIL